jgi:Ni,Fe-hydrogenase III large subunit
MNYILIKNNQRIPFSSIPVLDYENFMDTNVFTLMKQKYNHCVNYYGIPISGKIRLICCIANDSDKTIFVNSSVVDIEKNLPSFTMQNLSFEKFEREIHENFGIKYTDHPWLKPLRYPADGALKINTISNYPFYRIESEELHEVGVGPIHAGVIEPGHFRFICNGEQILHLEIQLGYQHRGIEKLFIEKKKLLQRATLAESIAGDTAVGHSVAFANLWESLCGYVPERMLGYSRTLALEHERIAIHTGDLSALCTDIAYQLGSSVFGRLRTPIINYFQIWCGNRLAKGLVRPGKTNFNFTHELADKWLETFESYLPDFIEMSNQVFDLPSALARLEKTGVVSAEVASSIGTVGMSARMSGINRDIRLSHPHDLYEAIKHEPVIMEAGDVSARAKMRYYEVLQSVNLIKSILPDLPSPSLNNVELKNPEPDSFVLSLVEGWRGEICHCAITDSKGDLLHYKIKDPSLHNWLALALAVRNNEISDFPISNKSFDLSYCGHDL